jgi:hypothetical protein
MSATADRRPDLVPLVAVLVPLAVYLRTLAPAVYFGDSGELNTAAFSLGIAHVPGYPLYALAGKLFCLLPLGGIAFRLNLMSAVCTALALGLLASLLTRLTGRRAVALAVTVALAFTQTLWEETLKSRAYPLNLLAGVAVIWALVRWTERGEARYLALAAFLFGLGLANHEILLVTAALGLVLVVAHRDKLSWPAVSASLLLLTLGLSTYLYLPVRSAADPMLDWENPQTLRGLVDVLLQRQYGHKMLSPDWRPKLEMAALIARSFATEFTPVPLALGIVGLAAMARRARALMLGLVLLVIANVAIRVNYIGGYEFTQIYRYLINSYAAFAVAVAFGLAAAVALVERRSSATVARPVTALLCLGVAASPLLAHARANDLSDHWLARDYARSLLAFPEQDALLFVGGDNDIYPIWDQQTTARFRQDVGAMGKAGFGSGWLGREYGNRIDPAGGPLPDLAGYDGPSRLFHARFEQAVTLSRVPVYAMYNDAEDPRESARWATLRERFDWWPRGLSIAFAAKGRRDLYRDVGAPFPWEAIPTRSLLDPRLVRDFHTDEVLGIYGGLFLKHGLLALSRRDPGGAERFFRLVLAIGGEDREGRANLAVALAAQGRLAEARAILEELAADPDADARVRTNLERVRAAQRGTGGGAR